jgi:hypothetical protein
MGRRERCHAPDRPRSTACKILMAAVLVAVEIEGRSARSAYEQPAGFSVGCAGTFDTGRVTFRKRRGLAAFGREIRCDD